ncbi:Polyketide synthase enoylreductase [Penicillium angulare]|uniref:Polyketide synthase enoylreductase n=1 Tax=Penicillium angulare TaxID=116970 RepID=UPI0025420E5E|nr:Polyketide synthase enoylreductase [Penicillium angulare]KAJ5272898.1 Polyketide synthase enoylreductase [Penicillium angulare]
MGQRPENKAAWLPASKVNPLSISSAPYTAPGHHQIVVKNSALGINSVDWAKQLIGEGLLGHIRYPFILGEDIAGTVVEVGDGVDRFNVGDRVIATASAISANDALEGGFQLYTVVREWMAARLPDSITFEQASVLPLALLTASHGLFDSDYLGLDLPSAPAPQESGDKGTVIITGGSSAVGSTAIQLAVSAGYDVISTASLKNFEYVKNLGASYVFDYKSETVVDDISAVVKGLHLTGGYSIGDGSINLLAAVLAKHDGPSTNKFIALAGGQLGSGAVDPSVEVKFILLGPDAIGADSVISKVYTNYLPDALLNGQFVPAPEPVVVGKGLEKIQEAFGIHMQGVSAKKIVVSL